MPFGRLRFVKTLVKFGIIYATDPLLQNETKIVCFRWLTFDIFDYKPLWTMRAPIYQNQDSFPHVLKWRRWPPIFFAFVAQVTHYLTVVKIFKKSIEWKMFARTSLKQQNSTQTKVSLTLISPKRSWLAALGDDRGVETLDEKDSWNINRANP